VVAWLDETTGGEAVVPNATSYEVAFDDGAQESAELIGAPVLPEAGAAPVGADGGGGGGAAVVNDQTTPVLE